MAGEFDFLLIKDAPKKLTPTGPKNSNPWDFKRPPGKGNAGGFRGVKGMRRQSIRKR